MEFGSDFNYIDNFRKDISNVILNNQFYLFACGRHALKAILEFGITKFEWKRIWMPEYFCYSVIDSLKKLPIQISFYPDYPEGNDISLIENIDFKKGDVLFRMNYFGLRNFRDNTLISVPVIEDHSHNLQSSWSIRSNADYCIASLRKTIPVATGGILWSPKNKDLPSPPLKNGNAETIANNRWRAMRLKTDFLNLVNLNKDDFLKLFRETEEKLSLLPISLISDIDKNFLVGFDLDSFQQRKKRNFEILKESLQNQEIPFLSPENNTEISFSFPLVIDSSSTYEKIRANLIERKVYPALLWPLPEAIREKYNYYLSLHCDGRYSEKEIKENLAPIIKEAF